MAKKKNIARERIVKILRKYPQTRSSDAHLCNYIWRDEMIELGYDTKLVPVNTFFSLLAQRKISNYETIRRQRAFIQSPTSDMYIHELRNPNRDKAEELAEEEKEFNNSHRVY